MIDNGWKFPSVEEVEAFLDSRNKYGSVPGLQTMNYLMGMLGNPGEKIHKIHIAGTNGKGSVGAYLMSIFRQSRMTTFHYSSPAVYQFREIWKRNGIPLLDHALIDAATKVYRAVLHLDRLKIYATRFEVETAMAFCAAEAQPNDILLLETGMGGAEDATNIIKRPKTCVFTNIGYDHMQFLGDTLTEIATAKAGIIKPACKVVSADQVPEVKAVLDKKMVYGKVRYVDDSALELISQKPGELKFKYKGDEFETSLSGLYQMKNAALAIEIAREMEFPEEMIVQGIKEAFWPARFHVIAQDPMFIIDGAHNVDAIKQLAETVKISFTNQPVDFIIGVLKDKEYQKMMEIIAPLGSRIYTITPQNQRGLDGKILAEEIKKWNDDVIFCETIEDAVTMAIERGNETGNAILAFGSMSYLGEVRICHDKYYNISRMFYNE